MYSATNHYPNQTGSHYHRCHNDDDDDDDDDMMMIDDDIIGIRSKFKCFIE